MRMALVGMNAVLFARFNMLGKFLIQLTTDSEGWSLEEDSSRYACFQGINSTLPVPHILWVFTVRLIVDSLQGFRSANAT